MEQHKQVRFGTFTDYVLVIISLTKQGYIHGNDSYVNRNERDRAFYTTFAGTTTMEISYPEVMEAVIKDTVQTVKNRKRFVPTRPE